MGQLTHAQTAIILLESGQSRLLKILGLFLQVSDQHCELHALFSLYALDCIYLSRLGYLEQDNVVDRCETETESDNSFGRADVNLEMFNSPQLEQWSI